MQESVSQRIPNSTFRGQQQLAMSFRQSHYFSRSRDELIPQNANVSILPDQLSLHVQEPVLPNSNLSPLLLDQKENRYIINNLLLNIYFQLFVMNFITYLVFGMPYRFIIIQLWAYDIISIFFLIYSHTKNKYKCLEQLCETVYGFFFKLFVIYYFDVDKFQIYYLALILVIISTLQLFVKLYKKVTEGDQAILKPVMKLFFTFQIFLITLKWQEVVSWQWFSIFLISWIALIIIFFIMLIIIVSLLEAVIGYCRKKLKKEQCIALLWYTIHLIGFSINIFIFLRILIIYYDNQNSIALKDAIVLYSYYGLYTLIITLYTLLMRMQINLLGLFSSNKNSPLFKPDLRNWILTKKKFPLKLIKISSTFFEFKEVQELRLAKQRIPSVSNEDKDSKLGQIDQIVLDSPQDMKDVSKKENKLNSVAEEQPQNVSNKEASNESTQNCLICFDKPQQIVFIPCKHGGVCIPCGLELVKKTAQCYICRERIQQVLKVSQNNGIEANEVMIVL